MLLALFAKGAFAAPYQRPTVTINRTVDWLLQPDPRLSPAVVELQQLDNQTIALTNGMIARVFAISPFFATWDITTGQGSAIRSISDEATVTLDGRTYTVGGAFPLLGSGKACPLPSGVGPSNNCPTAYLNRSTPYAANRSAFGYSSHWSSAPTKPFPWKPKRHAPDMPWPPLGLRLSVNMTAPADCDPAHKDVVVTLHYEMYQGVPAMSKWLTVTHTGTKPAATAPTVATAARKTAAAAAAPSLQLPVDQQGPICIQPCDAALPPSDWDSRWLLTPDVVAPIKMSGTQDLCLAVTSGTAYHSYNNHMNAVKCNASDSLQLWIYNSSTGLLFTRATNASVRALKSPAGKLPCTIYPLSTPPTVDTSYCVVDVNNHQKDAGTTLSVGAHPVSDIVLPLTPRWELVADKGGGQAVLVRATNSSAYPDRCIWHTPLPKPPAPPPPPAPKAACMAPDCAVLTNAVVEILRVNAPWSPSDPKGFWSGGTGGGAGVENTVDSVNIAPLPGGYGLLYPRLTQGHGTRLEWSLDPTFDPAYQGNDGAIQPMMIAGYDPTPGKFGGPGARLRAVGGGVFEPNNPFESFRIMTLFSDSTEDERQGLGVRKLTRLLAPQTSEAPMFMHLTNTTPAGVRKAVDQIIATGGAFDMIVFSFGSGFDLESTDRAYWAEVRSSVAYANVRGIEVGGYDLIALSLTGKGFDAIDPKTGASAGSTCFASGWNRGLLDQVLRFINATGSRSLSMLETDGPYGGTACGSTDHDHYGAEDSVQRQWESQVSFYSRMRELGVFVHAPDDYTFAGGANKDCGWYTEMQFSLPRWQHISISHTEVYDHTYFNTPTEKWMFAPLVDYHGGGPAAALEPFSETGDAWEWTLATYIGAGVGACYRGDRLFDTPEVQKMVTKWLGFWTKYRPILVQDIIHVKRPDMQSLDCIMHVTANSTAHLGIVALAVVYNPSLYSQSASLKLPLYYTGETTEVEIAAEERSFEAAILARDYSVEVTVKQLKPRGVTYFVVRRKQKQLHMQHAMTSRHKMLHGHF